MADAPRDDSVLLCTAGYDHVVRFWNAPIGRCNHQIPFPESAVNALEISPNKRQLAVAGNPMCRLYDLQTFSNDPLLTLSGHTSNILAIGYQKDQKWMFTAGEDGMLKIWDARTHQAQREYMPSNNKTSINTAVIHPNQGEIICGDSNGTVSVYDLTENKCRTRFSPEGRIPIRSISIAPDASYLAVANHKGACYTFRPSESSPSSELDAVEEKESVVGMGIANPCWDYVSKINAHATYCLKAVFSPDCRYLATTSADKTVKLWDVDANFAEHSVLRGHTAWVWDVSFSADTAYLVTASSDKTAKLWDIGSGQAILEYIGHGKAVTSAALNDS